MRNDACKKRKKRYKIKLRFWLILLVLLALTGWLLCGWLGISPIRDPLIMKALHSAEVPDYVSVQLLDPALDARNGTALSGVHNIVVHYVGNPGTTAQQNYDYFAAEGTDVCSHFIIGLEGEVIQCVPLYEKSAASNQRNIDTISIEVCHPDSSGQFTEASYASLVKLTAWLCDLTRLDAQDVIRHYDVTGKECPLYYVEHEDAWETFKNDVAKSKTRKAASLLKK